jgi:hypothetical protein
MKKRRFLIVSLCAALLAVSILIVTLRPKYQALYRVTYLLSLGGKLPPMVCIHTSSSRLKHKYSCCKGSVFSACRSSSAFRCAGP